MVPIGFFGCLNFKAKVLKVKGFKGRDFKEKIFYNVFGFDYCSLFKEVKFELFNYLKNR